jgi:lipopolysaccharide export system ATP-binding protein
VPAAKVAPTAKSALSQPTLTPAARVAPATKPAPGQQRSAPAPRIAPAAKVALTAKSTLSQPAPTPAASGAPTAKPALLQTDSLIKKADEFRETPKFEDTQKAAPAAEPVITRIDTVSASLAEIGIEAVIPPKPAVSGELHTLAVRDLHKRFGRKEVVRGVSFSMNNGEVAGLLGPNGAGKTTIFYMIVGFYRPSTGSITMDDVDITAKPMYRRARQGIAYLPQEASIFRKLTVEQNIWAILESRRDINKAAKKERLEGLLDEFGIARIRKQNGYTLSGGERRRTEIARALATEPKFLLLDEPFAGIDPIAVYEIKQIIRRLADKGIGILITDHNVRDTLEITTEAFIITDGTIVARGDRDVILINEMVREVYLGNEFKM